MMDKSCIILCGVIAPAEDASYSFLSISFKIYNYYSLIYIHIIDKCMLYNIRSLSLFDILLVLVTGCVLSLYIIIIIISMYNNVQVKLRSNHLLCLSSSLLKDFEYSI